MAAGTAGTECGPGACKSSSGTRAPAQDTDAPGSRAHTPRSCLQGNAAQLSGGRGAHGSQGQGSSRAAAAAQGHIRPHEPEEA